MNARDPRLKQIRDRFLSASAAPWTVEQASDGTLFIRTSTQGAENRLFIRRDLNPAAVADVRFIAEARNQIPRLVRALESGSLGLLAPDELAFLDDVIARASPGPWTPFIEEEQPIGGTSVVWVGSDEYSADMYIWLGKEIAPALDIKFIAHAREDLPFLLGEVRRRLKGGDLN